MANPDPSGFDHVCNRFVCALRQRVQAVVDGRFYRQKCNAQQVLAQCAQTARDETGMDKLTAELVRVVQETMQPKTVSLWLKPTGRENGG